MKAPGKTGRLILILAGNFIVLFSVYFIFVRFYPTVTLATYTVLLAGFTFGYVIYNRGFSRKGVTIDRLPDEWPPEKKTDFIEDGKRRLEKSKWMLTVLIPLILIYGYELFDMYVLPNLQNIFKG